MNPRPRFYDPTTELIRPWWWSVILVCARVLFFAAVVISVPWGTLALYYEFPWIATAVAVFYLIAQTTVLIVVRPRWKGLLFSALGLLAVLAWWSSIKPSNNRLWMPDVAVAPTATVDGDNVTIHHLRDFDYRSATDFTQRYRIAKYRLSDLRTVDFYVNYWGSPRIAHTMLSFGFANGEYVCISIETRKEVGEDYSAIKGFFRQYELIYIAATERDVVRVRPKYRGENVYLYRLQTPLPVIREVFLDYLNGMNELAAKPKFYNVLTSNCTNNIRRHTKPFAAKSPWSWKLVLNGYIDEMAYENGALDQSLPFAELKARSLIDEAAKAADQAPDFSAKIRAGRPGF